MCVPSKSKNALHLKKINNNNNNNNNNKSAAGMYTYFNAKTIHKSRVITHMKIYEKSKAIKAYTYE